MRNSLRTEKRIVCMPCGVMYPCFLYCCVFSVCVSLKYTKLAVSVSGRHNNHSINQFSVIHGNSIIYLNMHLLRIGSREAFTVSVQILKKLCHFRGRLFHITADLYLLLMELIKGATAMAIDSSVWNTQQISQRLSDNTIYIDRQNEYVNV